MKALFKKDSAPPAPAPAETIRYVMPDVNVYENKEGYVIEADMPGVSKDGLEITLANNEITLIGHQTDAVVPGTALYRQRQGLGYRRVFELDPVVDPNRITARMHQGVLFLSLPKSEAVKPRKIVVSE
ncbi:MAG: Hsp20/alpha crystallin family protein [Verrucomicrobiae bacterium]|nr:Hsp20/alpha crystallin family protein [Verrucomicrobiae bacterium]